MKLTKKEAKRLSVIKWKFYSKYDYRKGGAVEASGKLLEAHPELEDLEASCGFCEYVDKRFNEARGCEGACPLGSCNPEYANWARKPSQNTARAMLRKIQKVKV